MDLTFAELSRVNALRHEVSYKESTDNWTITDWTTALAGEVGELCNLVKKARRGDGVSAEQISDEIADIVIYADLLAQYLDMNLASCVRIKFNKTSRKRNCKVTL